LEKNLWIYVVLYEIYFCLLLVATIVYDMLSCNPNAGEKPENEDSITQKVKGYVC